MVTCPWCGTHYLEFQSNCDNCGGSLPPPPESLPPPSGIGLVPTLPIEELPSAPPLVPRKVPPNYAWRILSTDSLGIVAIVFSLLGIIFAPLGIGLTVAIVTAFVGLPFTIIGILFLAFGLPTLYSRIKYAQQIVGVLKSGEATLGQIMDVQQNFNVRVNRRYPWTITYRFQVNGRDYKGKVTTLSTPSIKQQPGKPVYVLYMPDDPDQNTIYPNPYGYLST